MAETHWRSVDPVTRRVEAALDQVCSPLAPRPVVEAVAQLVRTERADAEQTARRLAAQNLQQVLSGRDVDQQIIDRAIIAVSASVDL